MAKRTKWRWGLAVKGLGPALLAASALLWVLPAIGVSGADFTTVNDPVDGPGHCQNGNANVNCNLYTGKAYVWLNGGPPHNGYGPDGQYFFAVLVPGNQPNPNDRTPPHANDGNLSDEHTSHTQRTFTITNGKISAYAGPHQFAFDPSAGVWKIRLSPYSNTTNNGDVYTLATCYLGPNGTQYPVDPRSCKYDAFKVPGPDKAPPACPNPTFGVNSNGQRTVSQIFSDDGGIDSIEVKSIINATWTLQNYYLGTPGPSTLTATKIDQTHRSFIRIVVTDVAGNQSVCDPVVATLTEGATIQRFSRLARQESKLTIRNGRPGVREVAVVVNRHLFRTLVLRNGQTKRLNIRRAMRAGHRNTVVLRAIGLGRHGKADVMIAN